jgi:hypothetical protein
MRTVCLGLLIAAAVSGCAIAGGVVPGTPVPGTPAALPEDMSRIGTLRPATASEALGAVSESQALQTANDEGYRWADPTLFLVMASNTRGPGLPDPERLLWIVRWSGLDMGAPAPATAPGASSDPKAPTRPPLTRTYVLIDAKSGEFVSTMIME